MTNRHHLYWVFFDAFHGEWMAIVYTQATPQLIHQTQSNNSSLIAASGEKEAILKAKERAEHR